MLILARMDVNEINLIPNMIANDTVSLIWIIDYLLDISIIWCCCCENSTLVKLQTNIINDSSTTISRYVCELMTATLTNTNMATHSLTGQNNIIIVY